MKRLRWIPLVLVGQLALLTVGSVLLAVFESGPATATLKLSGHPFPGSNKYAVTLTIPSGGAVPTEGVKISDSGFNGCSTDILRRVDRRTFTGSCSISDEVTGDTVRATYNSHGGDRNYSEAASNTLTVPQAPPPVPTVSSVTPDMGPIAGGTRISITGTGFIAGATVVVAQGSDSQSNTVAATDVKVISQEKITAVTGGVTKAGPLSVYVTTKGGTNASSPGGTFTYLPVPTVASVTPNRGPTSGGTAITVDGTGFVAGARVVISQGSGSRSNTVAATDVTVDSPDEITAVTGGGANVGTRHLYVITAGGTSTANAAVTFTYTPVPTVTAVTPDLGSALGGTHISITGTGFQTGATVLIEQGTGAGSATVAATDVKVYSATKLTAVTGKGTTAGTWNVFVTTAGGTSVVSPGDAFTYLSAPTVSSVTPSSGPTSGGTPLIITGSGFTPGAIVTIGQGHGRSGALPVADVKVVSPDEITAVTPGGAKAGTWGVYIADAGGYSATGSGDSFTYAAVPTVSSVTPDSGPVSGGTPISITGTGFATGATVTFAQSGGSASITATDVKVYSPTRITAVAGGGAQAGTWNVLVTTAGGTSTGTPGDAFTYR
jgi:hypothetical protein